MQPGLAALVDAASGGRYHVLGELGRDEHGPAYLARERTTNSLVALRVTGGAAAPDMAVHRVLGAETPGRGGACPFCRQDLTSWCRYCPSCGGDLAAPLAADDTAMLDRVLSASAGTYELLGEIPRAEGGTPIRFARERTSGELVALSLTPPGEAEPDGRPFQLTATRLAALPAPGAAPPPAPGARPASWPSAESENRLTPSGQPEVDGPMVCATCGAEYPPGARFCINDGLALQSKLQKRDLVGEIIAGRYQLLRSLGEGGMGRVFLAEQIKMGRKCAIKVLHGDLARNPESVARFSREAREAGRLDHPNIVQIHDFGEDQRGLVFLAMEYVDGPTLGRVLHQAGGPLPLARSLAIASQVAEALVAAHAAGLVHRDIKPDNILVASRRDGGELVKVVDFGIAKALHGEPGDTLTRTGFAVGTSRYMSPEQLIADPVDGRTDIYCCGCVLWEMLVGEALWQGGQSEFVRRLQQPAPSVRERVPSLPLELDELLAQALAPRPAERIQTAGELRDRLDALQQATSLPGGGASRAGFAGASLEPVRAAQPPVKERPAAGRSPAGVRREAALAQGVAPPTQAPAAQAPSHQSISWLDGIPLRTRRWAAAAGVLAALLLVGMLALWRHPARPRPMPTTTASSAVARAPASSRPVPPATQRVLPAPRQPAGGPAAPAAGSPTSAAKPPTPAPVAQVQLTGVLPPDAVIRVDGKRRVSRTFSHTPGDMTVEVAAPGYAAARQDVRVHAGTNIVALRALEPRSVARPAPAPGRADLPAPPGVPAPAALAPARAESTTTAPPADPAATFREAANLFVQHLKDVVASGDTAAVRQFLGTATGAAGEVAALQQVMLAHGKARVTTFAGRPDLSSSPPSVTFALVIGGYGVNYQAGFGPAGSSWHLIRIRRQ